TVGVRVCPADGWAGRPHICRALDSGQRLRTARLTVDQGRPHRLAGFVRPPPTGKDTLAYVSVCPGTLLGTASQGDQGHSSIHARGPRAGFPRAHVSPDRG